MVKTNNNAK